LVLAFQFTPFKIEWVGLVVIGIYTAIYSLVFLRRAALRSSPA
jgi:prolipoprotein diacylglyceryltransferase